MTALDRDVCRLIVETGLAAVNHGFLREAETIRAALPHLTSNESAARLVDTTLLFGLGRQQEALDRLCGDTSAEAAALRRWMSGKSASSVAALAVHPTLSKHDKKHGNPGNHHGGISTATRYDTHLCGRR